MTRRLLKIILIPIKIPIVITCIILLPIITTADYLTNPDSKDSSDYYWSWNFTFCKFLKEIISIFE